MHFFFFLRRFTWAEMPDKKTVVKIGVDKTVYHFYFVLISSYFVMTFANLHIAFTYMAALEHNFDICLLKLSWLSISIPVNFTDLVVSISSLIYVLFDSSFIIHNNSLKLIEIGYQVIVSKPIYHWFGFFFKCTEKVI